MRVSSVSVMAERARGNMIVGFCDVLLCVIVSFVVPLLLLESAQSTEQNPAASQANAEQNPALVLRFTFDGSGTLQSDVEPAAALAEAGDGSVLLYFPATASHGAVQDQLRFLRGLTDAPFFTMETNS